MCNVFWKCLLRVSRRPYAKPYRENEHKCFLIIFNLFKNWSMPTHKKNRMVTRLSGHRLWRKVRVAAEVVLRLSTRRPERFLRMFLKPMAWGVPF
jgi:hypothetical protein